VIDIVAIESSSERVLRQKYSTAFDQSAEVWMREDEDSHPSRVYGRNVGRAHRLVLDCKS